MYHRLLFLFFLRTRRYHGLFKAFWGIQSCRHLNKCCCCWMVLFFSLDREWGTTRASLFSFRIIDNSEGTPNEFFVIVNGRTFEEFQGVNINSYFHTIFFKYPTIEKGQLLSTNTCTCTYKYITFQISHTKQILHWIFMIQNLHQNHFYVKW